MWSSEHARALVVEDNAETRAWLVSCVNSAFPELQVVDAANLASAMELVSTGQFDLALVDLGLPDGTEGMG